MPQKFLVDGRFLGRIEEGNFDEFRAKFKENVIVDDLESWQTVENMQKYDSTTFIERAHYYFNQKPPDLIQSAEKIWFAAVYAVKKLFLSCGEGIDLRSHDALKFFCRYALSQSLQRSEISNNVFWKLSDIWVKAEKKHRSVYGSVNIHPTKYLGVIADVEFFVEQFRKLNADMLWDKFNTDFITGCNPEVTVKQKDDTIRLGGYDFKCKYSVTV